MSVVLVTGGSGFIAAHCILQLLAAGHEVRTTVRSAKREGDVRAVLQEGGVSPSYKLAFFVADLEKDEGWAEAAAGCDYVLHVASPFPSGVPKHEDELIIPAREGALRLLRAAKAGGVKRVVLTSSFAAIGYGHPDRTAAFDETVWSNASAPDIGAYAKSKTLAEKAAWEFIAREGNGLELAVVNPVGVFGPVLAADYSTSILLVQRLMDGALPGLPNISFGCVDVRDVADLHIRAMIDPAAKGERFLAVAGDFIPMAEIARILREGMGEAASRVPTRRLPNWMVRMVGIFDPAAKLLRGELGKSKNATNAKARTLLGWQPRSNEQSILATAESLVRLGLLKGSAKKVA